jgi:radical SAM superfamily enzyme YgiQ (UPF0313 family)
MNQKHHTRVDVLFVNPPSPDGHVYIRDINRSGRRSREQTIWPQTSLAYLAAVVKNEGYTIDIIDCIAEEISWNTFKEIIELIIPKFVVINVITSIVSNDLYTAFLGKYINAATIAVGPHISSLPEETLKRFPCLDCGIIGEAEITIKELILNLDKEESLEQVKGLVYRDKNGDIQVNPEREFIENLDELPIPLHELLPVSKYRLPYIGSNYTFVLASRGCPFKCTFCRQPIMWKRQVRKRSAQSLFNELKYLNKIGINNIMFHADTFTIDKGIVIELCNIIIREKLKVRWICNSRVDTIDSEMLVLMKKAGCWMIAYGIESGSDQILQNVKKGEAATVAQAKTAVLWTKKAGIKVWAYFIIGLPGENHDTVNKTIQLAKTISADIVNFAVGAPYPGTELYDQARENKWLESESWEKFDQNYSAILSFPGFSSDDTIQSIGLAYKKWYLRPSGFVSLLKGINSWKDLRLLFRIGIEHLKISK